MTRRMGPVHTMHSAMQAVMSLSHSRRTSEQGLLLLSSSNALATAFDTASAPASPRPGMRGDTSSATKEDTSPMPSRFCKVQTKGHSKVRLRVSDWQTISHVLGGEVHLEWLGTRHAGQQCLENVAVVIPLNASERTRVGSKGNLVDPLTQKVRGKHAQTTLTTDRHALTHTTKHK